MSNKLYISDELSLPANAITQTFAIGGLSREHLEEVTGYKRSTRDAYIQRLQSRRLVEIIGRGEVKPTAVLFA